MIALTLAPRGLRTLIGTESRIGKDCPRTRSIVRGTTTWDAFSHLPSGSGTSGAATMICKLHQ